MSFAIFAGQAVQQHCGYSRSGSERTQQSNLDIHNCVFNSSKILRAAFVICFAILVRSHNQEIKISVRIGIYSLQNAFALECVGRWNKGKLPLQFDYLQPEFTP